MDPLRLDRVHAQPSVTLRSISEQQTCRHRDNILPRKSIPILLGIVGADTERTDHKSSDPLEVQPSVEASRHGRMQQLDPFCTSSSRPAVSGIEKGSVGSCPQIDAHS